MIGGSLFALGGRLWRRAAGPTRGLGLALLAGVFISEGCGCLTAERYYPSRAALLVLIGVGLLAMPGFHRCQHTRAVLRLLAVLPFGFLGEALLDAAVYHIF